MLKHFKLVLLVFVILTVSKNLYSQYDDKYYAEYYFFEGKTRELQGDNTGALENYISALKFENSPSIHYAVAGVYYNLGKNKDALAEINKCISINSSNVDYQILHANIQLSFNNVSKAIEIFESVHKNNPENIQVAYTLARIYEDEKMPSKAIELYENITEIYGFDYEVLRRMYEIYFNYKNYSKCLESVQYLLKLDPYNFDFKLKLAALYQMTDQPGKALSLYEDLYAFNPGNKDVQTDLIKLYFLMNDADKGFNYFSKILGKESLTYEEKIQIGEVYYNLIESEKQAPTIARNIFTQIKQEYPGKWQPYFFLGAIDIAENKNTYYPWYDSAIAKADTSIDAYVQVAFSYYNRGNYDRAIAVIDKGYDISPNDFRMNYVYGLNLQRLNKLTEAVSYYENALLANPGDLSLLSTLGMAYNTLKRFEDSDNAYERALRIDPEDALVLNNYAYNLSQRGEKLDKAMKMSRKSIERDPKNPNLLDTFGWIYYKLGEYKDAEMYLKQSLAVNSGSAVVQEHLGDVYFAMKDYKSALIQYKKSLELNPNSDSVKLKIENLKKI